MLMGPALKELVQETLFIRQMVNVVVRTDISNVPVCGAIVVMLMVNVELVHHFVDMVYVNLAIVQFQPHLQVHQLG